MARGVSQEPVGVPSSALGKWHLGKILVPSWCLRVDGGGKGKLAHELYSCILFDLAYGAQAAWGEGLQQLL